MPRTLLRLLLLVGVSACGTPQPLTEFLPSETVSTPGGQMPQLIGGIAGLQEHVNHRACRENSPKMWRRVDVYFTVDENGNVLAPSVPEGLGPACDAEAIRVVREHAKFIPGRLNGELVKVKFTLPVAFQ